MKLIDYICQASGWTPGFDKPRKPGIVKRLGDLSKRALDGFKFFAA